MTRDDDLFKRAAREGDVLEVAAAAKLKLFRSGREHRGACPIGRCGSKDSRPFVIQAGAGRWKCYVCSPRWGDAVDLEHRLHSTGSDTMADAARRLLKLAPVDDAERERRARKRDEEARAAAESDAWKAALAARIWREAVAAQGGPVETYLSGRGLYGPVLGRMLDQVRFHPRCYWGGHPEFGVFLPAMIGLIVAAWIEDVDGEAVVRTAPTGGVHCTYLAPDGRGKARRDPAKKMWGPQGLWVGDRPVAGGVWLTRPDAEGELDVGEGMESAASASIILGGELQRPRRTVATLSLDRMQGGEAADRDGRVNVREIEGDPDRPPFTWPEAPSRPWGRVNVAVDRDMRKPVPVRGFIVGRTGRAREVRFMRAGDERTRVCAALATAAWRGALAAGSGTVVRAVQPGPGRDFNDELLARAGDGAAAKTGATA